MQTLFTERHAIEIAFKNLENDKKERRAEMRADIQKIDDRLFFIMDRIKELDEKQPAETLVAAPIENGRIIGGIITGREIEAMDDQPEPDPIKPSEIMAAAMKQPEPIREKHVEQKTKQFKSKPIPNPIPEPKQPRRGSTRKQRAESTDPKIGADMLIQVLGAAEGPLNAPAIGKEITERFGKTYANIHGQIATWMKHTDRIQKIGTKYSLDGKSTI